MIYRYENYDWLLIKAGFVFIGEGEYRTVFQRKGIVVKIPRAGRFTNRPSGVDQNIYEAYAYKKYRNLPNYNEIIFAPCRLMSNKCLMMKSVRFTYNKLSKPKWVSKVEGAQCGFLPDGRVVAYDSGSDLEYLKEDALRWAGII